jgi:hypothetical protein
VRAAGGFDTSLPYAEDFDLWIRVLERGTGVALPEVVYLWRRHAGSKSLAGSDSRQTHRQIARGYAGRPWWTGKLVRRREAVAEWDDMREALAGGRWAEGLRRAGWICAHPGRVAGVAGLLLFRFRIRRRTVREAELGA